LQYEVIEAGKGPKPTATDKVTVHYTGTFLDGTEFDSTATRGTPASFSVTGVIAGWTEALQLMQIGAKYRLYIHPDLGYGEKGRASIPPNSLLIFDVELLAIK
jgi:FKBP-type peptidyl-prolyl cis-trans isomerase